MSIQDKELLEFILTHPIAGGDGTEGEGEGEGEAGGTGEGEGEGEGKTGTEGEGGEGSQEGEEGSGSPPGEGEGKGTEGDAPVLKKGEDGVYRDAEGNAFLPKTRFDEVNEKYQGLKTKFDAPKPAPQPAPQELSEDDKVLKEDLQRLFPELKALPTFMQGVAQDQTTRIKQYTSNLEARCTELLGEVGIEKTDAHRQDLEAILGDRIARDPKMFERFMARDVTVVDDAWKGVKSSLFGNRTASQKQTADGQGAAKKKGQLPRSTKPGASMPGKPTEEKEITSISQATERLNQAHEAAFERLNQQT